MPWGLGVLREPVAALIVVQRLERYGADAKASLPALMSMKLDGDVKVREATKAVEKISAAK